MQATRTTDTATAVAHAEAPDIRRAALWRDWDQGVREAEARQAPILCLAEPYWTNSAQRLAHVMRTNAFAGEALLPYVPIRIDPIDRPDLVATQRFAAVRQTGGDGPPLLSLLTHEGLPFLNYCTMFPEGDDTHPSLPSLLRSVAELYATQPGRVADEARRHSAVGLPEASDRMAAEVLAWTAPESELDDTFGGIRGRPKHPNPPLLELLMHRAEGGDAAAREQLSKALTGMYRGGILDQLAGRFHRCARDERWIVPHFEMTCTDNAALAAIYARAASLLGSADFAHVATSAARFALSCLQEGACAVASSTHYYTWTAQEMQEPLDPALIQALGLHFKITPHPSRHVLYRAREPKEMAQECFEPLKALRRRLEAGKSRLALHRARRTAPALVALEAPSWAAETVRQLYLASRAGADVDPIALRKELQKLIDAPYDSLLGYSRGSGHYLEDQAAVALCCATAYGVDREPELLAAATRLARIIRDRYYDPDSGALYDRPRNDPGGPSSRSLVDTFVPAAVSTTIRAFDSLSTHCQDAASSRVAQAVFERYLLPAAQVGHRAASYRLASLARSRQRIEPA